jgi:nitroreductase
MIEKAQELCLDAQSTWTSQHWPFGRKMNTIKDTDGNVSTVKRMGAGTS